MSWLHSIGQRYRVSEDPLRTLRRIEMVALLLVVLLCLQLAVGGFRLAAMTGPEPVQPAPDSLQVPQVYGPVVVAADERNEIITRPLFWTGRQPESAVVIREDAKGKAGNLKGIKLVGVFGSGERAGIIALVKDKKRRILVGESLEGWKLKSIKSGEIVLRNGDRREKLILQRGKVAKAPPEAKVAGAGAGRPVRQYTPATPATAAEPVRKTPGAPTVAAGEKAAKPASKPAPERGLRLGPR